MTNNLEFGSNEIQYLNFIKYIDPDIQSIKPTYVVTINSTSGSTIIPENGIYSYINNTDIELIAISNGYYIFNNWVITTQSGTTNYINNPLNIKVTSDMDIMANFDISSAGKFMVLSYVGLGETTPSDFYAVYPIGDEITIEAVETDPLYKFKSWDFNGIEIFTNPYTFNIYDNKIIIATFEKIGYYLNVVTCGIGDTTPSGTTIQPYYDDIIITAIETDPLYKFNEWNISGNTFTNNPLTIVMNSDKLVDADFEYIGKKLHISQAGNGSVNYSGSTIHVENDIITLIATDSDSGYTFTHWVINDVIITGSTYIFTILYDTCVLAIFEEKIKYDLTIYKDGLGSVSPIGNFKKDVNEQTIITASEISDDYYFLNHSVDGTPTIVNPLTITSSISKTVVTNFSAYNKVISVFNTNAKLLNEKTVYEDNYNHNDIYSTTLSSNVFNGTSSAISGTCPLIGQKQISIEFEVIPTLTTSTRTIISWGGFATNKKGMQLMIALGVPQIQYSDGTTNGTKIFSNIVFANYNYYHCIFNWNGLSSGTPTLTVNGTVYNLASAIGYSWTGDTTDAGAFKIGSTEAATPLNFFAGAIPYMKVTNDNVVMMELIINYGSTSDQTTIWDVSGNNRHATLINSVVATFWNATANNLIDWNGIYGGTVYTNGSIILVISKNNNLTITNYTRIGYYNTGIFKNTSKLYMIPVNTTLNSYITAGTYTWQQLYDIVTTTDLTKIQDAYNIKELKIKYK